MIAGELVLGVLGLTAAVSVAALPGVRRHPAVARHLRLRIALLATFGVLFGLAAASGRNVLAPLAAALLVASLLLLVSDRGVRR